jgi:hypothetical protein
MGSFERRASSGFRPELRGGDNDVLQLACGFLWVLASAMRGGIYVCLSVWVLFVIDFFLRMLLL